MKITANSQFLTEPIAGGWMSQCLRCDRLAPHHAVNLLVRWQDAHTCARDAENRVTLRKARAILATLTPDPVDVILARQRDLLTDTDWHDTRGRRTA